MIKLVEFSNDILVVNVKTYIEAYSSIGDWLIPEASFSTRTGETRSPWDRDAF